MQSVVRQISIIYSSWITDSLYPLNNAYLFFPSVQFSGSVMSDCDPMSCSMQGLPVQHNSQSLPKLMSIELVMPSNHLILCHPLLLLPSIFPSIRVFSNESAASGGQSIGVLASTSDLPMNTQD